MRGRVQIYKLINDEQILIEDSGNMVVDKAGEIIVDALTISPSLSGIASASAILDTSNYTIQAISFGKDAAGYSNHAHAPGAASANCLTDGKIRVLTPEVVTVSSYHSSAITTYANGTIYNLLPEAPTPLHERLETKSTLVSAVNYQIDTGHNLNFMKDPPVTTASTSSIDPASALVGCFAPSGGIDWNIIVKSLIKKAKLMGETISSLRDKNYDVDHIIPCCLYNLEDANEVAKCYNKYNLRWLPAMENSSKAGHLRPEDLEIIKTLPQEIYPKGFNIEEVA